MIVVVQRLCLTPGCGPDMLRNVKNYRLNDGARRWSSIEVLAAPNLELYEEYVVTTRWDMTGEQFDEVRSDWYGTALNDLPPSGIVRYECSCYETVLRQDDGHAGTADRGIAWNRMKEAGRCAF